MITLWLVDIDPLCRIFIDKLEIVGLGATLWRGFRGGEIVGDSALSVRLRVTDRSGDAPASVNFEKQTSSFGVYHYLWFAPTCVLRPQRLKDAVHSNVISFELLFTHCYVSDDSWRISLKTLHTGVGQRIDEQVFHNTWTHFCTLKSWVYFLRWFCEDISLGPELAPRLARPAIICTTTRIYIYWSICVITLRQLWKHSIQISIPSSLRITLNDYSQARNSIAQV